MLLRGPIIVVAVCSTVTCSFICGEVCVRLQCSKINEIILLHQIYAIGTASFLFAG